MKSNVLPLTTARSRAVLSTRSGRERRWLNYSAGLMRVSTRNQSHRHSGNGYLAERHGTEPQKDKMKIIGDGGHASVVRDLALLCPVACALGGFVVAVGDNVARKREALSAHIFPCNALIHPSAVIAKGAVIGDGTVILEGAVVQVGVKIGRHVIINAGAVITHDCVLEDYVHIAPGAHLCGNVHIGEGTLVGVGVGIGPNTTIPAWSIVKAAKLDIEPCPTK